MNPPAAPALPVFRRLVAAGSAALVLLLGVLAASPALHAWFHGETRDLASAHAADSTDTDDAGCAVLLFSAGVTAAAAVVPLPLPPVEWRETPRVAVAQIFPAPPRYLRQPERGPPSLG